MIRKYIAVVFSGLVLVAALIFLVMNIGDTHTCNNLNIYNRTLTNVNIDKVMVLSAVAGVILWIFVKMFARNSWGIFRERRKQKQEEKRAAAMVEKSAAKNKEQAPAEPKKQTPPADKKTDADETPPRKIMDTGDDAPGDDE